MNDPDERFKIGVVYISGNFHAFLFSVIASEAMQSVWIATGLRASR